MMNRQKTTKQTNKQIEKQAQRKWSESLQYNTGTYLRY